MKEEEKERVVNWKSFRGNLPSRDRAGLETAWFRACIWCSSPRSLSVSSSVS